LVGFHDIWPGDDAIQGDVSAIIFNPIFTKFKIINDQICLLEVILSLAQQWFEIV
jgi:hypothetical protein